MRVLVQVIGYATLIAGGGITIKNVIKIVFAKGSSPTAQKWAVVGLVLLGIGNVLITLPGAAQAVATICDIGVVQQLCGNSPAQRAAEEEKADQVRRQGDIARAQAAARKAEEERKAAEQQRQAEAARAQAERTRIERDRARAAAEAEAAVNRHAQERIDKLLRERSR